LLAITVGKFSYINWCCCITEYIGVFDGWWMKNSYVSGQWLVWACLQNDPLCVEWDENQSNSTQLGSVPANCLISIHCYYSEVIDLLSGL